MSLNDRVEMFAAFVSRQKLLFSKKIFELCIVVLFLESWNYFLHHLQFLFVLLHKHASHRCLLGCIWVDNIRLVGIRIDAHNWICCCSKDFSNAACWVSPHFQGSSFFVSRVIGSRIAALFGILFFTKFTVPKACVSAQDSADAWFSV